MKRINILFLLLSLDVGGTERHIYYLVSNLDKKKFNPVICCLYDLGSLGEMLVNEKGVKVYHNLMRNKWDIFAIWKLFNIIKKENTHILFTASYPLTQFWAGIFRRLTIVKASITRIGGTTIVYHAKRRLIVNKIMQSVIDKIIAQASLHKEYLIHSERLKSAKIEVIYNGVDLEQFRNPVDKLISKQTLNIPVEAHIIGIVARLSPVKGHWIFLKAAKKVLNVFSQVHFLIVGDGSERERLENITCELLIQSNVHFLWMRKDIPQIVSLFDIGVLSSYSEATSNAVLEYMAAGKPVVATNVGSIAEQVIDGETGFLISPGDYDAMADKILRLLNNPELAKKMGEAGKERVKEKFTLQEMVSKYEALFIDLMNKNSPIPKIPI